MLSEAEGNVHHPGPLEEIDFWEQKAVDLNGIFEQLQSDRVRKILRYLDRNKWGPLRNAIVRSYFARDDVAGFPHA